MVSVAIRKTSVSIKRSWFRSVLKATTLCLSAFVAIYAFNAIIIPHSKMTNWSALFGTQAEASKAKNLQEPISHIEEENRNAYVYDFSVAKNGRLSSNDWNIELGKEVNYNGELQVYTDKLENLRIENGELVIQANRTASGNYTSARINTKDKFSFTYGTLEVDMKLPRGNGAWPAAWLMPQSERYSIQDSKINSSDPYAWVLNGEIDFMESVGHLPGQIIPAAHSYNEYQRSPVYTPAYVSDLYDRYHRYGIIKKPGSIVFTVDGVPYASRERTSNDVREWPFEQSYYLILNVAVGGKWAGEKGIDESTMPWKLNIRSVSYKPL